MPTRVRYIVHLNPEHYDAVRGYLDNLGLHPNKKTPLANGNPPNTSTKSDNLYCIATVNEPDAVSKAFEIYFNLCNYDHINDVNVMTDNILKKEPILKRPLVSLAIPSLVSLVTLIIIISDLKPNASMIDYLKIAILPTILSFASAVGIKYSP